MARNAAELTARAETRPLLAEAKESALQLVLNAPYFESASRSAGLRAAVEDQDSG